MEGMRTFLSLITAFRFRAGIARSTVSIYLGRRSATFASCLLMSRIAALGGCVPENWASAVSVDSVIAAISSAPGTTR